MEITNLKEWFARADREGFGILAFNYNDVWDLAAIVEAAEEEKAPIMVEAIPKVVSAIEPRTFFANYKAAEKRAKIPMIQHLDHCKDPDYCKMCVDLGFKSIMYDGSLLPLEENIANLKDIVKYAHAHGCMVEGEIGKIKGRDAEGTYEGDEYLVKVDEAVYLATESGVDSLAVGIGNAHGFYTEEPKLNFKRLAEVNEALDIPLVMHGGTGIPAADMRRAIENGINKVNVGTQIRYTYMKTLHKVIEERGPLAQPVDVMAEVRPAIKQVVKEWIHVCKAEGRA